MRKRTGDVRILYPKVSGLVRMARVALTAAVLVISLGFVALPTHRLHGAANPSGASMAATGQAGGTIPLAESLGVRFIPGSSSTVLIERDGKTYLVDLADRSIQEKDSPSVP